MTTTTTNETTETTAAAAVLPMYQVDGSSNIKAIGYVVETNTLFVEFLPGRTNHTRTYGFQGVPSELFTQFLKSESKGKFFSANIKGKFDPLWEADEEPVSE
jgi:hypothetical protein